MPRYEYLAKKWNGEEVRGTLDVRSQVEARAKVKNLGYKLITLSEPWIP